MESNQRNFLSVDGTVARSSYDEYFEVGETVLNDFNDFVKIVKFELDHENHEVFAVYNKGKTHVDFLNKVVKVIYVIDCGSNHKLYFDNYTLATKIQSLIQNSKILTYELK